MALPDLAVAADLSARGVDVDTDLVDVMLAVASSLVREAAGSPILETDSTVTLWVYSVEQWLDLPGWPVTDVASVEVDGVAVTDYTLADNRLWRSTGWGWNGTPIAVTVSMTHGLPEVPEHIKQLVCDLAIVGINTADQGAVDPRVVAEKIDDYSVTFAAGADQVASAMTVPKPTRFWLHSQFGGGASVVTHR